MKVQICAREIAVERLRRKVGGHGSLGMKDEGDGRSRIPNFEGLGSPSQDLTGLKSRGWQGCAAF